MAQHNGAVPPGRRRDAFGIHSIGEFVLEVPALQDAERFYGAFGLEVVPEGNDLALRTRGHAHRWGRIVEGPRKHLRHVSFHCFGEDRERFGAHLRRQGIATVTPPRGFEGDGLWFNDPDGLLLEVRAGVKTSPDAKAGIAGPLDTEGVRCAPYRRMA